VEAPGHLQLANHLDAPRPRPVEHLLLQRHSRARDDQIGGLERRRTVTADFELDSAITQTIGLVERRSRFGQRHAGTPPHQEFCCCDPAAGRADDDHAPTADREVAPAHTITAVSALSD